jgi:hypothetical protein
MLGKSGNAGPEAVANADADDFDRRLFAELDAILANERCGGAQAGEPE